MIEQLIIRVFATRNAAHLAHWAEASGYRHETLGAFYDDVIVAMDAFVEAHQGAFDLVKVGALPEQPKTKNIEDRLEEDMLWFGKNRKKITGDLPALDNLLQEVERVYLKALYKLRNLK